MKKLLSVVLAIMMIAAALPLAFASETIIEPYERISVTASASDNPVLKFVPAETKTYIVTSYADYLTDPRVIIYDATCEESYEIEDGKVFNFCEKYEFVAGHEYYLTVATAEDTEATFDVALECIHVFVDGNCVDCEIVCDHEIDLNEFPACMCGMEADYTEINLGATLNTEAEEFSPVWYRFTPDEDVTAVFYSNVSDADVDTCGSVYDSEGEYLVGADDFLDTDFVIFYDFVAGETYYLKAEAYSDASELEVSLVVAKHTTDDGEEHDVILEDGTYGTCQEIVYTAGVFCAECDSYIVGHTENGYGSCSDDDGNRFCDYCGKFVMPDIFEIIIFLSDYIDFDVIMKLYDFVMRVINFFKAFFPFELSGVLGFLS